jgi:hypothetical protein
MKCEKMDQYLVSLLYGELEPEEEKQVKAHLKSCTGCRNAFKELQKTSSVLEQWEDESPRTSFVFVEEKTSRWQEWKKSLGSMSWGRRLALGVPAGVLALLVLFSLLSFKAEFQQGQWSFSFGSARESKTSLTQEQLIQALSTMQAETLEQVAQMVKESEMQQRRENTLTLAQFARDLEERRQEDLRMMGQGLEGLHRTTQGRLNQTQSVLNDLIQLAGYQIER